jgi:hypothetical protein
VEAYIFNSIDLTKFNEQLVSTDIESQQPTNHVAPGATKSGVDLVAVGSSSSDLYHTLLNTGWALLILCCFSMSILLCLSHLRGALRM